jgi:putative methyltransferase
MQDESFNFGTSFTNKKPATTSKPAMSLYHEAARNLDTVNKGKTSLKAEIFGKKTWKTDGKTLFALTSEAAKWSSILAEVVEKSGILKLEKVRSPAYLQTH